MVVVETHNIDKVMRRSWVYDSFFFFPFVDPPIKIENDGGKIENLVERGKFELTMNRKGSANFIRQQ